MNEEESFENEVLSSERRRESRGTGLQRELSPLLCPATEDNEQKGDFIYPFTTPKQPFISPDSFALLRGNARAPNMRCRHF